MEEILGRFNPWWYIRFETKLLPRNKYLDIIKNNLDSKDILFLTGLRRVGKTSILKEIIYYLLNTKKVDNKKILFVSLDDIHFTDKTIFNIIEKYREINNIGLDDFFYLFLDEVTYVNNFEQQLKNLYDTWNVKVICSSSIASLLNDNKAFLTGRVKTIEVFPLDFKEYLIFKNLKINPYDKILTKKYFEDYMKIGGLPEFVLNADNSYIRELINSIIYKDIIAQNKIKDERTVKELFRLLCQRIGKPTSYNKLANILRVSDLTIKKYIDYFEKSFMFYSVEKYSKSVNENLTSPRKFYIADLGIKNYVSLNKEKGVDFENLIFLNIKSKNPKYFLDKGIEIDFITKDSLIEAKYFSVMDKKQEEVFNKIKRKYKKVISDYSFFLD